MNAAVQAVPALGPVAACEALGVSRASLHRLRNPPPALAEPRCRPSPPRALTVEERAIVLGHLHAERFQDRSPAEVYGTLLDEGVYCCSIRTLYRVLAAEGESRERRDQLIHPPYQKPQLLATAPNQLWSWDITKLAGPRQVDLLLPLCNPRRLQPVCRRLDGGASGGQGTGPPVHRRNLCQAPDRPRPAHPPRRPGFPHDLQARGLFARRSGRHQ